MFGERVGTVTQPTGAEPVSAPAGRPGTVFMLTPGRLDAGTLRIGLPFLESQVRSVERTGWRVVLGVVDDRTSLRGVARNARRLRGELARSAAAVVHAQYGSVTAAIAAWVAGALPLVVSFCGDDLLGAPNPGLRWRVRSALARRIGLAAALRASAIIVKSRNLLEALPRSLRRRAIVLPNGVDLERFTPLDRAACRAALGWDPSRPIVLFNAGQEEDRPRKNPGLARAAVRVVARRHPEVSLVEMAGAAADRVPLILNASDCLLVTSLHEGSPNIVKEAMACGLPIVSVPCGDVSERLARTRPGAVCGYDAEALGRAVADVLDRGGRSNGRAELVAQGLDAARIADRLRDLYARLRAERLVQPSGG